MNLNLLSHVTFFRLMACIAGKRLDASQHSGRKTLLGTLDEGFRLRHHFTCSSGDLCKEEQARHQLS